jgi:hypothetical protein
VLRVKEPEGEFRKRASWRMQSSVIPSPAHDQEKSLVEVHVLDRQRAACSSRFGPAHSARVRERQGLVLQLQQQLGNAYVQRVMAAQRGVPPGCISQTPPVIARQTESETRFEQGLVDPVPPITGKGEPHVVVVQGGGNLRLQGRTRARFNGGSFRTENVVTEPGTGCPRCRRSNCIHVTGTLMTDYQVSTAVTLPRVSDFRRLTPCQRERIQDAIDTVLSPQQQQHVDAFETYNGTTQQPFDLTLCRNELAGAIRRMVTNEEGQRRAAARAASGALDPFSFDVELECTD